MLGLMLLLQLFKFEDFASVLAVVLSYNDQALLTVTAALVVVVELFALPYLIGMAVSPLLRIVSGICAAGTALFWLISALTSSHADNSGLFGAGVAMPGGVLAVLWSLLLVACIATDILYLKRIPSPPTS
jgi:hypothetical protein